MYLGLPWWLEGKESACNAGELGSIPGLGRSPREGNGCPLQYSCLENSMVRGAWEAIVQGVTKSWIQLSNFTHSQYVLGRKVLSFSQGLLLFGCWKAVAVRLFNADPKLLKDYILCQCGHWSLFLSLCSASVLIEISLNAGNLQVLANWHWSSTCQACTVPKDQPKKKLRVFSGVFWACVLSWAHTWFSKFPHLQSCFYF